MGLDMYAYVANKGREQDPEVNTQEIAYWRKHPNLHGWMEQLAEKKNLDYDSFNGVELELEWEDIKQLENDIKEGNLPGTKGFFFGSDADEYYKPQDLKFCIDAKTELFLGRKVFYNSSW